MYLARKMTQAAYSEIGEYFGGRNHSTVMSAEKRVRDLLASQSHLPRRGAKLEARRPGKLAGATTPHGITDGGDMNGPARLRALQARV